MIGLDPDLIFRSTGDHAEINRRALTDPDAFVPCPGDPLDALRALLAESRIDMPPGLPPMSAGIFGYLGYDMVRRMERLAPAKPDPIGVPEALLIRPTVMVVFDGARDEMSVVTPVRPAPGVSARAAYESAMARLDAVVDALESPLDHTAAMAVDPLVKAGEARSNTTEDEYKAMVARAKDYIAAGDAFQIVLSQRFTSRFDLPAFALYRALRRVNPSPYLCFLDFGAFQIVCSSPEILVRVRDGKVVIRPIAGTRPRGKSPTEDEALAAELLADPKERAEHLMLLDLGRNDVGRVAKIGSVKVTDSFFIERYSHVMHIVSNVEGELRDDVDAVSALAAGFPAGTVSGAPKVRAMQIIDELEKDKRGIYAGCIGYFGAGGEMDTCIVLRASVVKDGLMHVQAGAGIVYDSSPAAEQNECVRQGARLVPRGGRSGPVRGSGQARAVGAGVSDPRPDLNTTALTRMTAVAIAINAQSRPGTDFFSIRLICARFGSGHPDHRGILHVHQENCLRVRLCRNGRDQPLGVGGVSSQSQALLKSEAKYAPIQSISYDFGSKSMSGYFVEQAAKCVVMLMVYEKRDPDAAPSSTATRVRLVLNPGQTAGLDSEEGRSLNFTCGEGATALLVDVGEREKLVELQRLTLAKDRQRIAPGIDVATLPPYAFAKAATRERRGAREGRVCQICDAAASGVGADAVHSIRD